MATDAGFFPKKKVVFVLVLLATTVAIANVSLAGGSYIQCDPRNPSSPIRCSADGW